MTFRTLSNFKLQAKRLKDKQEGLGTIVYVQREPEKLLERITDAAWLCMIIVTIVAAKGQVSFNVLPK